MPYKVSNYTLLKELLKTIPQDNSCMEWPRSKVSFGYGQLRIADRRIQVHRMAYILMVGEIPDGLCVLHQCDNPPCFRPSHLFLGTKPDNTQDCIAKGRARKANGSRVNTSKLTEPQVIEMRQLHANGWTESMLVTKFGVRQTTVNRIVRRLYWKHLADQL